MKTNPRGPGRHIDVDERHPTNQGVLAWLRAGERARSFPLSVGPADVDDPYHQLGTHPDVVEHLWDRLGRAPPVDGRCVVFGHVALAQPTSGVVLALGLGTSYALRLAPTDLAAALEAGHEVERHYRTSGTSLDLSGWGVGWCFGGYGRREPAWFLNAFEHYAR